MPKAGIHASITLATLAASAAAGADIVTHNAETPADNPAAFAAWLASIGISEGDVEHLVDFETGFVEGQNVSGVTGLLPGGMVITDSDNARAIVTGLPANMGGSNPIGTLAVSQNEQPYLELDFTLEPVDYVSFFDIDQQATSGIAELEAGGSANFSFETTGTGGDSAEFFGIFRNDMPRITRILLNASGDGEWAIDEIRYGRVDAPDGDGDGIPDSADNCTALPNADQRDTNGDNFGNACDADLDNSCVVNFADLGLMKAVFFTTDDDADLNGDGSVNFSDLGTLKAAFFGPPGPSGLPNACDAR